MTLPSILLALAEVFERAAHHLTKSADKLMLRDIERAWRKS